MLVSSSMAFMAGSTGESTAVAATEWQRLELSFLSSATAVCVPVHRLLLRFSILFFLAISDAKTTECLDFLLETLWSLWLDRLFCEFDLTGFTLTPRGSSSISGGSSQSVDDFAGEWTYLQSGHCLMVLLQRPAQRSCRHPLPFPLPAEVWPPALAVSQTVLRFEHRGLAQTPLLEGCDYCAW